jgi:hypothetical protein
MRGINFFEAVVSKSVIFLEHSDLLFFDKQQVYQFPTFRSNIPTTPLSELKHFKTVQNIVISFMSILFDMI